MGRKGDRLGVSGELVNVESNLESRFPHLWAFFFQRGRVAGCPCMIPSAAEAHTIGGTPLKFQSSAKN